jgi:hypothetical protein
LRYDWSLVATLAAWLPVSQSIFRRVGPASVPVQPTRPLTTLARATVRLSAGTTPPYFTALHPPPVLLQYFICFHLHLSIISICSVHQMTKILAFFILASPELHAAAPRCIRRAAQLKHPLQPISFLPLFSFYLPFLLASVVFHVPTGSVSLLLARFCDLPHLFVGVLQQLVNPSSSAFCCARTLFPLLVPPLLFLCPLQLF